MSRTTIGFGFAIVALCTVPSPAQPRQWSDDFTSTATYDGDALFAPCYGGPSTKYSVVAALSGDIYNEHVVSGGRHLTFTSRTTYDVFGFGRMAFAAIGVVDMGQDCPDNPDPSPGTSMAMSEPFTSNNLCMYGGHLFDPWQLTVPVVNSWNIRGADGQPGVANIDDDLDGTTDDADEAPPSRPTTVGSGYGNGVLGFRAGRDAAPGALGVDDDGNGVVDDIGETGWTGSDDGDDTNKSQWLPTIDGDFARSEAIYLGIDPGSSHDLFSIREIKSAQALLMEYSNEITHGYYQPRVHYNWVFCTSGTCYGAALWVRTDMSNPVETVGPVVNTTHTGATANVVGIIFNQNSKPVPQFLRQMNILGNSNFADTFWVISGNPVQYYPSPSPDLDGDKDVDGFDFLTFSNCYNGSNRLPLTACTNAHADLDQDGDVDGFDFLTFSNCYNGSNRRPLTACFPPNLNGLTICSGS